MTKKLTYQIRNEFGMLEDRPVVEAEVDQDMVEQIKAFAATADGAMLAKVSVNIDYLPEDKMNYSTKAVCKDVLDTTRRAMGPR